MGNDIKIERSSIAICQVVNFYLQLEDSNIIWDEFMASIIICMLKENWPQINSVTFFFFWTFF